MAYSSKDWEIVRAYFERGFSLAEIVAQEDVEITDRSSISKRAKTEGWLKGSKSTLVEKEIQVKQDVKNIKEIKSTFNSTELMVHNSIVDDKLRQIAFFNNATEHNISVMLTKVSEETSIMEHRIAQAAIKDGKEVVLGKAPETAIQVNNNGSQSSVMADLIAETTGKVLRPV